MFIHFDMIHEHDRRTHRHRMTAIAAHMHRAAKTDDLPCVELVTSVDNGNDFQQAANMLSLTVVDYR